MRVTPVKGKAILVSGHDLKDLEELLKQTEGKGINVYTHGEMLPAPRLSGAEEVQAPGRQLRRRVAGPAQGVRRLPRRDPDDHQLHPEAARTATRAASSPRGLVAWPGVHAHRPTATSRPVIEAALARRGFAEDAPEKTITVGFGHNAVLGVADKVIEAVKSGADPALLPDRRLRRRQAGPQLLHRVRPAAVPDDCVILTLACGKYRFNKLRLRRHRRHPAPAGRRPVQRRLLGHPDRRGAGRGVRLRRQRPAAVAGPVAGTSRRPWPSC